MLPKQEILWFQIQAKPNLVEGIGGVGDQLPQEDLLVAVKICHVKSTLKDTQGRLLQVSTPYVKYYL